MKIKKRKQNKKQDKKENKKEQETESAKLLKTIQEEMQISQVGFFDIHAICKREHLQIPKYDFLFDAIQKAGHKVARTHFSLNGIRTTMSEKEVIEAVNHVSDLTPYPACTTVSPIDKGNFN